MCAHSEGWPIGQQLLLRLRIEYSALQRLLILFQKPTVRTVAPLGLCGKQSSKSRVREIKKHPHCLHTYTRVSQQHCAPVKVSVLISSVRVTEHNLTAPPVHISVLISSVRVQHKQSDCTPSTQSDCTPSTRSVGNSNASSTRSSSTRSVILMPQ
jgi:hypothetical protein